MINKFTKEFFFLSNFYFCGVKDINVIEAGEDTRTYQVLRFNSSEALFQSLKCKDTDLRKEFTKLSADKSKKMGRSVELRENWEQVKISMMEYTLLLKFGQNSDLSKLLLETGDHKLVEGNTWNDKFWGVSEYDDQGENHLGILLMELREELNKYPRMFDTFEDIWMDAYLKTTSNFQNVEFFRNRLLDNLDVAKRKSTFRIVKWTNGSTQPN